MDNLTKLLQLRRDYLLAEGRLPSNSILNPNPCNSKTSLERLNDYLEQERRDGTSQNATEHSLSSASLHILERMPSQLMQYEQDLMCILSQLTSSLKQENLRKGKRQRPTHSNLFSEVQAVLKHSRRITKLSENVILELQRHKTFG